MLYEGNMILYIVERSASTVAGSRGLEVIHPQAGVGSTVRLPLVVQFAYALIPLALRSGIRDGQ